MVKAWAIVRRGEDGALSSLWGAVPGDLVWSGGRLRSWLMPMLKSITSVTHRIVQTLNPKAGPLRWETPGSGPKDVVEEHLS